MAFATYQAKLAMWHLMFRVPLHFAAIPEKEILNACNRFNLPLETWRHSIARQRSFRGPVTYSWLSMISGERRPHPEPLTQGSPSLLPSDQPERLVYTDCKSLVSIDPKLTYISTLRETGNSRETQVIPNTPKFLGRRIKRRIKLL